MFVVRLGLMAADMQLSSNYDAGICPPGLLDSAIYLRGMRSLNFICLPCENSPLLLLTLAYDICFRFYALA